MSEVKKPPHMLVEDFWSGLEELNDVTKYLPGQGLKLTEDKLVHTFFTVCRSAGQPNSSAAKCLTIL